MNQGTLYLLNHSDKYEWKWIISYWKIWNSFLFQLLTLLETSWKYNRSKKQIVLARKNDGNCEHYNSKHIKNEISELTPVIWSSYILRIILTLVWMQSIGLPTYCLVVTMTENVNRMTEEIHLLKYLLWAR